MYALKAPWVALEALCVALEALWVCTGGPMGRTGGPMGSTGELCTGGPVHGFALEVYYSTRGPMGMGWRLNGYYSTVTCIGRTKFLCVVLWAIGPPV